MTLPAGQAQFAAAPQPGAAPAGRHDNVTAWQAGRTGAAADAASPYAAFDEVAELAADLAEGDSAGLVPRLSALFARLAELNDFPGVLHLYEALRDRLPAPDATALSADAVELLLKVANARLREGALVEAEALLGALMRQQPGNLTARRLAASLLRVRNPALALHSLQEVSGESGFRDHLAATLTYLDLLAENRMPGLARAEILRLQDDRNAPQLALMMANLERLAADKLVFLNRFLAHQQMAPLALREGAALMALDAFDLAPRPAVPQGPLVSVIMTTYNSAAYVATAIRSIQAQSHGNWELLVVDDASSDTTPAILHGLAQADARIRVLQMPRNGGTYVAKNRALAECRGEFVTCHDSDDIALPDRLARQLAALQAVPAQLANTSRWVRIDNAGQIQLKSWGLFAHLNPASLLFRRQPVLDSVGYFDSVRVGADTEFRQRILLRHGAAAVGATLPVLALGRHHGASLTQSGAGLIDDYGVSPTRRVYTTAWLDWHLRHRAAGTAPFRSADAAERPFAVPGSILPQPVAETTPQAESWQRYAALGRGAALAQARAATQAARAGATGAPLRIVHAIDLSKDNFLATVALNHLAIELEGGRDSAVWNLDPAGGRAWQGNRMAALRPGLVRGRPADGTQLLFVYGAEALRLARAALPGGRQPGSRALVLVRNPAEAEEARALFAELRWQGEVLTVSYLLFRQRGEAEPGLWPGALAPSLQAAAAALPPAIRLGVALQGREIGPEDIAFLTRLRQQAGIPITVLADEASMGFAAKAPVEILPAQRGRNFWNDLFGRAALLVEPRATLEQATLFEAPGQALQRGRLVAALGGEARYPGARGFAEEAALIAYLRAVAGEEAALREAMRQAAAELDEALGGAFHLRRLGRLTA
ncbi:glycosyltransferase family 2 protein [Pseudoroseomonas cervicalis]|uniref:glycosyltransferase family 2 protein n=1 Tax=Teichococcus cervicalis TaxID=204525 RepID=UPI0022F1A188|nr:glycosyltransferase family 2 protein [Pseudoroseomonas cervicalis]WBV44546.1 glycosyltransferase family 2 protein [Pseudoroseomonas cervicalis]